MLILSRNIGQSIVIGKDIYITVLGVKGSQVRLGIDAPEKIKVLREELLSRVYEDNSKISSKTIPMTPKIFIRKKSKMILPQNTAH